MYTYKHSLFFENSNYFQEKYLHGGLDHSQQGYQHWEVKMGLLDDKIQEQRKQYMYAM